jgi:hypothetical protein
VSRGVSHVSHIRFHYVSAEPPYFCQHPPTFFNKRPQDPPQPPIRRRSADMFARPTSVGSNRKKKAR